MVTHIIIQSVRDDGRLSEARMIKVKDPNSKDYSKFFIQIDGVDGRRVKILTKKQLCKLCEGTGGMRYWYAQDDSVKVNCPICNGGSQEKWDKEKAAWARHTGR